MEISHRSRIALDGVHPDLVAVVERAHALGARFEITEGLRSLARQRKLLAEGASKTLRSRHLTGHAVDFVACDDAGKVTYAEMPMKACARVFKKAADDLEIEIEWGGDWKPKPSDSIGWDSPHLQLPWKLYAEAGAAKPVQVTPKQLAARGSRIAAASEKQKKDGAKGGGAEVAGHVVEYGADAAGLAVAAASKTAAVAPGAVPAAVPSLQQVAEQAGALQATAETLERFIVFVAGKGGLIGTCVALYFLGRMAWNAGWIGTWRAEDANDGKTGM